MQHNNVKKSRNKRKRFSACFLFNEHPLGFSSISQQGIYLELLPPIKNIFAAPQLKDMNLREIA
jgi:hypothetical protein